MAASAVARLPLQAHASSRFQRICPPISQWHSRRPKTTPRKTATRQFGTSVLLNEKKYTKDHEWIELSPDGKIGTIGISKYAAKQLGDVVYVELPTVNMEVNHGDSIGCVESVKSASDINTPITGKIMELNEDLMDKPSTINKGPEAEGWIARIEVGEKGKAEVGELMGEQAYDAFTAV